MDKLKQLVRQHWDWRAADFDHEASHGLLNDSQARAWRELIARLGGTLPLDVLDAGCGTGFLSLLLAAAGHRVTGIDFAPSMLRAAHTKAAASRLAVQFCCGDAEAPTFRWGSFDVIVERHVLWTLPHPDLALAAWRRLLRANGRLVLIEGHWEGMEPRDEYVHIHQRLPLFGGRPPAEISELMRSSGFHSVLTESLMQPELWTERPGHPRYLVTARVESA
jgi:ubiquinone/menaquinone biosynthesis C-methylase UbiE